jgi:hypothetical protein
MPRFRWFAASLVVMAAGGLGWWMGHMQSVTPQVPARVTAIASGATGTHTSPSPPEFAAPRQRPPNLPLPDPQRPLREVLPDLRARADAGEPDAACRLAAEMEYCDRIAAQLSSMSEVMRPANTRLSSGAQMAPELQTVIRQSQQAMSAGAEQLLRESEHCEGVAPISASRRLQYWRSAALGGNVAAMRHYAVGNAFRTNETLDNLDNLRVYQHEAETVARRAVAAGDLPTIMALAAAHSPAPHFRRHLLAQTVAPDRSQALALYMYAQSLMRDEQRFSTTQSFIEQVVRNLEQDLDSASVARAHAQASDYLRKQPTLAAHVRGAPFGHTPDVHRQECAPP